ncbi:MAG TPA: FkbM family methyltransferase [Gaiellaceae bacterium]|jgi:FkbM family methyltransferase
MIRLLGRLAANARRLGLGGAARYGRDGADAFFRAVRRPPLKIEVDGIEIRGFLRHRSFLAHLGGGGYETFVRSQFLAALADADLVLDVGSHTGFYALLASRGRPGARVIAVEPDSYNVAALRENIRAASAPIELVAKAASDRSGRAVFHQNLGTVGSSLVERRGTGPIRVVETETTTIDEIVGPGASGTILLKLDVEGAEGLALAGAERTLRSALAATAIVELNPLALAAAGSSGPELVQKLEQLGFDVSFLDEEQRALVAPGAADRKGNLLARRV